MENVKDIVKIQPKFRKPIMTESHAHLQLCYKCGGCDSACPMNMATGLLNPRKIVWMANLGLIDELLHSSWIWYCLMCNRCAHNCPMTVQPSELIAYLRREVLEKHIVSYENFSRYRQLMTKFQRVRWHMADQCLKSDCLPDLEQNFSTWMEKEIELPNTKIIFNKSSLKSGLFAQKAGNSLSCFTCCECSSACPVSAGRDIVDPVWIFRMVNLGFVEELVISPSIWLCLGCRRCTQACSQGVVGHELIQAVREFAVDNDFVDQAFLNRWNEAQQMLNRYLMHEIDKIFESDNLIMETSVPETNILEAIK